MLAGKEQSYSELLHRHEEIFNDDDITTLRSIELERLNPNGESIDNDISNEINNEINDDINNDINNDINIDINDDNNDFNNTYNNSEGLSKESTGKSSLKQAFMNMANSILGAGIIGQPFAFKNSGLAGGLIIMIILTVIIDWTLRLIVINAELSNKRSYQGTVNYCFGKIGKYILLLSISLFAMGGCIAFSVIIGDTFPHVSRFISPSSFTDPESPIAWIYNRNVIITFIISLICYPLSLNKEISKLAKYSAFALVGMLNIIIICVVKSYFIDESLKASPKGSEWIFDHNIFQGISIISFALVCHHNAIFIYHSLKSKSIKNFNKLTHLSCFISMICCIFMGVNGFVNFGNKTNSNILNNFDANDIWINFARLCFGLNMVTTFPLEIFVVRDALKSVLLEFSFFKINNYNRNRNNSRNSNNSVSIDTNDTNDDNIAHTELSTKQNFILTTFLVFLSMLISLLTSDLGVILELIGATSASLLAYIIPPLCYIKLSYDKCDYKNLNKSDKRNFIFRKLVPSTSCIIFGFLVMIISSYMTLRGSLKNNE